MKKEEFVKWLEEVTETGLVICFALAVSVILMVIKYLFFV